MIYLGNIPVGVAVDGKIGEFTKYEKKVLTFANAQNNTEWSKNPSIPCSFTPKLVVFYGGDGSVQGGITRGAFVNLEKGSDLIQKGFVYYINLSSGESNHILYNYGTNAANTNFNLDDSNNLKINRASGNGFWSNTYEYTFEIYG